MIELVVTSFPFVLRVFYLRWKGMPITLYNVHYALVLWVILALIVFFAVFYYYPKSFTGIVPFRSVPVVAENGGTVTEVFVEGGDHVKVGDPLFNIENSTELAKVDQAKRKIDEVHSAMEAALLDVETAEAKLDAANSGLKQARMTLDDHEELKSRASAAYQPSKLERATTQRDTSIAEVKSAKAQLAAAKVQAHSILPAQLASAQSALNQAEIDLDKTEVRSFVNGTVEQVTLHKGSRAAQAAMSPAMVIIPDRSLAESSRIVAGFSQVSHTELYEGMAAEIACESNFNISMANTVLPARITRIQDMISSGQMAPSGRLMEPGERVKRGQVVAHLDLIHPEHQELLVPGSGCIVQAYTTDLKGSMEGSFTAHVIAALGVIKAVGLRIKAWLGLASGIGIAGSSH
ncbi:Inner membrane protein YiaV precursor [Pseudovibrio axinellae]|uniref:Inner membrane protein YiaV n=1 Tax=Pseudovibrio axinellae TaxID=989403 RepID=A0A165ZSE3_9HYPH|nr:biotin/lipoyl-binding protein [Pseudovibrio axinellae]KZL20227.1 Inner membrane protein YiaV precursor [Pseudovibrio axinellae]SEQ61794.1 Multidrug resistance efflux pump [Pseudovibrio axinellae]